MLYYLLFGTFLTSILYSIDAHTIMKNRTITTYNRYKQLKNIMNMTNTNTLTTKKKCIILYKGFFLISKILYASFLQYINTNMRIVSPNVYEITYVIKGRMHKLIIKYPRGPPPVMQIINDKEEDVTDVVIPYMGPNYDWYGNKLNPSFFGYETLSFEMTDGNHTVLTNKTD